MVEKKPQILVSYTATTKENLREFGVAHPERARIVSGVILGKSPKNAHLIDGVPYAMFKNEEGKYIHIGEQQGFIVIPTLDWLEMVEQRWVSGLRKTLESKDE